jgi:hypothetical protein
MIGTHTDTDAPRISRHANKPAPDADVRRAMSALDLTNIPMRARKAHRYGILAGRHRVLRELGLIAESHGPLVARMVADRLAAGLADGSIVGSKHAFYEARAAARRLDQGGQL